jgi:hypothetical protein
MSSLRHPPLCLAALAVYLAVNIGAGALHHHGQGLRSERGSAPDNCALQLQSTTGTDSDGEEDACLLCRVLHLARTLSIVVRVEAVTALAGQALPAVAIARPHFLETATHSRAPPLQVSDQ